MRLLVVNVLYPPQAFGGATIVADQTAQFLAEWGDDLLVVTADQYGGLAGSLHRYNWQGIPVISVAIDGSHAGGYRNRSFATRFAEIAEAFRPDAVLVHCIQSVGASFLEYCESRNIPRVIFVHDAWWLCERQFMISRGGSYCFQKQINADVCRYCVDDPNATQLRDEYLRQRLEKAASILFPSAFFRDLYVASGISADRCHVVKNGVRPPSSHSGRKPVSRNRRVRFGFVGGVGPIKGADLIKEVFERLERTDYELVCVDNMMNLGAPTAQFSDWIVSGRLRRLPGYTQQTIDEFFERIDVLLFPSQWKESFGLAVREALIRHKWVIATDGGGTTEDIVSGVNGTVIPLGHDIGPLRAAVLECFERDWKKYRNPHADRIVTFERQATALRAHLQQVCGARHCNVS